jgi:aminopeptidase N
VLHYEFSLSLNDSTDRIEGSASVTVKFLSDADSISFDLSGISREGKGMIVSNVLMRHENIKWNHTGDRLTVYFKSTVRKNDTASLVVNYYGIPSDGLIISENKFGDRVFFSDNWPDRAHNYIPCIDHPYDKASVDFIITAPGRYSIVANGICIGKSDAGNGRQTTHWSEPEPLPVKVMAFGAAPFSIAYAGIVNGIPVTTWVFPQNGAEGFSDYAVAVKPLQYFMDLIGAYPYEKLANVQSKTIYGGMENASCIFYSENSVTGKGKAEPLMAHEIAHQWFGDCVTEADWHHIWLSEGFATYLTSMYIESAYGEEKFRTAMASARERVIDYSLKNDKPVIDTTVNKLMTLLNVNSYQKGAWVLHMLRNETGDSIFINGIRLYYKRFHNLNALTDDFMKVMEEVSGRDLTSFFKQWLRTSGQPELKIWYKKGRRRGTIDIYLEQEQSNLFEFNIELLLKYSSSENKLKVPVKERTTRITVKTREEPVIIPDPEVKLLFRKL